MQSTENRQCNSIKEVEKDKLEHTRLASAISMGLGVMSAEHVKSMACVHINPLTAPLAMYGTHVPLHKGVI